MFVTHGWQYKEERNKMYNAHNDPVTGWTIKAGLVALMVIVPLFSWYVQKMEAQEFDRRNAIICAELDHQERVNK